MNFNRVAHARERATCARVVVVVVAVIVAVAIVVAAARTFDRAQQLACVTEECLALTRATY